MIYNTLTNKNEKTPTPKTKATYKELKSEKKRERESLRDRLRKGYEESTKIVRSGEDELQSFRDIREGIWGREFYNWLHDKGPQKRRRIDKK